MNKDEILEKCLDLIEDKEYQLLVWGIVEIHQSKSDLLLIIDEVLEDVNTEQLLLSGEILNELIQRKCIFEIALSGNEPFYRSRMAESVRLIFHLRQSISSKSRTINDWQKDATLVSDFRFIKRHRLLPRRDKTMTDVLNNIKQSIKDRQKLVILEIFLKQKGEKFRLAKFQIDAAQRILKSLEPMNNEDRRGQFSTNGTIISAGTGGGKTLAFYLPTLCHIAAKIEKNSNLKWVQCLSLYPRTELLKNQFSDVFKEVRYINNYLSERGLRKLTIGALYGGTPFSRFDLEKREMWKQGKGGYVCPYLKCPEDGCGSDLVWPVQAENQELLKCEKCSYEIDGTEIVLTRDSMRKDPPDILFSTTEMLNQNLSDVSFHKLFGIGRNTKKPEFILLDEIHTYAGYHGAQVSFLLRRLFALLRTPICFVGLSATLKDGERFFSRLTPVFQNKISDIKPAYNDLEKRGSEYLLAIKGDPVSQTALLSTTIQLNMVMSRMLDPIGKSVSKGFFGQKIFSFTDDLDVANRLYFQLLDVEGRDDMGNSIGFREAYASLRSRAPSVTRYTNGQDWRVADTIEGNHISRKRDILRVSSQDPGIIEGKDIVVATASLEVGIDDENVGVVIQHKKPKSNSSFVQRKGRAGRSSFMRPWTMVVLSDYGQDRIAYQMYEHLFDPEITPSALPIESKFIHHIQSVYVLMEFVAIEVKNRLNTIYVNIWKYFSEPIDLPIDEGSNKSKIQKAIIQILEEILSSKEYQEQLEVFLTQSLILKDNLSAEELIRTCLWDHPRPLMTEVIPTILRRLKTNWGQKLHFQDEETFTKNSPLPEFAPSTLFGELNLPEVTVILPSIEKEDAEGLQNQEMMPILKALKTFAPGRISRRFGVEKSTERHWVVPKEINYVENKQVIDLDSVYVTRFEGVWSYTEEGVTKEISVYRPKEISVSFPDEDVQDTSNAFLTWETEYKVITEGDKLEIPKKTALSNIFSELKIYSHANQNPLMVRRFSLESNAELKKKKEDESFFVDFRFEREGERVAIGFEMEVDGLEFSFNFPNEIFAKIYDNSSTCVRSLRVSLFRENIENGELKNHIQNPFLREWLGNIYLNNLIFEASFNSISLETANQVLKDRSSKIKFSEVLEIIFQAHSIDENQFAEESEVAHLPSQSEGRLKSKLEQLLNDRTIIDLLFNEAKVLFDESIFKNLEFLKEKFVSTLAGATFNAFQVLCPEIDSQSIILDIKKCAFDESNENFVFYISETSPGGVGVIEEFMGNYSKEPNNFFRLIESSLRENELEISDRQLREVLEIATNKDSQLCQSFKNFRNASTIDDKHVAFQKIRNDLKDENIILYHGFITSLSNRILKPGTFEETDLFLKNLIEKWLKEERRLGVEIDARVIALTEVLGDTKSEISTIMSFMDLETPDHDEANWRFNVVSSFLWGRGDIVRNQNLSIYNPFKNIMRPERLLLRSYFFERADKIHALDKIWKLKLTEQLSKNGFSTIVCPLNERKALQNVLNVLTVEPIETDYLKAYARLVGIRREGENEEIDCELIEAF